MAMTTRMVWRTMKITVLLYATWADLLHAGFLRLGCRDRLPRQKCLYLKTHSVCQTHPGRMEKQCPKTCQFCDSTCKDKADYCHLMARGAYCFRKSYTMERDCPYSCGFCQIKNPCKTHECTVDEKCYLDQNNRPYCKCYIPQCYHKENEDTSPLCTTSGEDFPNLCAMLTERCKRRRMLYVGKYTPCKPVKKECKDAELESKHGLCKKWKEYNFCINVRSTMERLCNKTCGFCDEDAENLRALSPPKRCVSNGYGCCWNDQSKAALGPRGEGCDDCADLRFCARFQMNCGDKHNRSFMKKFCPKCCGYCVPSPCEDKNDYCPTWAEIGECEKNPGYMNLFCRKACGLC